MKNLKKKNNLITFLFKYETARCVILTIALVITLNISFYRYVWSPFSKKTLGNAIQCFLTEILLIILIMGVGYMISFIFYRISAFLRFRYLPLDKEEISKNNLYSLEKYVDFIGEVIKTNSRLYKFLFDEYPKLPQKLEEEMLICIAKNYGTAEVTKYLETKFLEKQPSHIKKWKEVFHLDVRVSSLAPGRVRYNTDVFLGRWESSAGKFNYYITYTGILHKKRISVHY